ncbi:hypothetical protein TrVE_jg10819 [Triparma verrucosa]|uniref:Methyltransferase type 11 domain-containing protein n=1 Tax=Triparma verrucosa TaxID=1606542 RepID=A0A9W7BSB5_9STRA|nr:hypothetical protein TrVE_jg10819 [Triparma verrucosa]
MMLNVSRSARTAPSSCRCERETPFGRRSAEQYEKIAGSYDDKISADEAVMGIGLLRRHLIGTKARGRVLEVAAGTGRNLDFYKFGETDLPWWLKLLGSAVEGEVTELVLFEKSQSMAKVASKKVARLSAASSFEQIKVDVGDCTDLSRYSDETFDTVIDTFGLCSFDDPVRALKEMQRVCKKDGRILLIEHGRTNTWPWLDGVLDDGRDQHIEKWGCEWNRDIDQIIQNSNLVVEWCDKWHFGTTSVVSARPGGIGVRLT